MKLIHLTLIVATGLMLGACKEKKQTEDIITTKYVPKRPQAPIAMPHDSQTTNVDWLGKQYAVDIVRTPVDSLPMVSDDTGQKYIDNRISLSIRRSDGSVFFEKTFVKGSFQSYVDESFIKSGVLASICVNKVEGPEIRFSVVIGQPDAVDDVYVPLQLAVNNMGGISIKQDNDMGMLDYEDDDEVEEADE